MYERKCENWLATFGEWVLPVSEVSRTWIFWTGVFSISSALRRHVKIPSTELFGDWDCDPNFYIMFVAPPGMKKSSTMKFAKRLLKPLSDITQSPQLITKEKLLQTLATAPDQSICIWAPEFGEFIVKSGPEMYSFLTNMYDGQDEMIASVLSRPTDIVEKPCVNLLGATTPVWISKNMPEEVIGGGFASRVIFLYEDQLRKRQLIKKAPDKEFAARRKELQDKLIADLKHIALDIYGDFEFEDSETADWLEEWYQVEAAKKIENPKMRGYQARKPATVLKLAMCLHVAYSDELYLSIDDLKYAIKVVEESEMNLPAAFEVIGAHNQVHNMERIFEYVQEKENVPKEELFYKFRNIALPSMLEELVAGLVAGGYIAIKVEKDKIVYTRGGENGQQH